MPTITARVTSENPIVGDIGRTSITDKRIFLAPLDTYEIPDDLRRRINAVYANDTIS